MDDHSRVTSFKVIISILHTFCFFVSIAPFFSMIRSTLSKILIHFSHLVGRVRLRHPLQLGDLFLPAQNQHA